MELLPQECAFVDYVKKECKKHGIKLDLRKRSSYLRLSGNIKCSGYFDSGNMELVVAAKRRDFVEILAHEYGHLTQWVERCPEWVAAENTLDHIDRWLQGEEVEDIRDHIKFSRDLELDNEKRTVELIKKFELPIDTVRYTKKANGYVYFYTWMMSTRRWSKVENSPYSNETVIEAMPDTFQDNYEDLPEEVIAVFEEVGL